MTDNDFFHLLGDPEIDEAYRMWRNGTMSTEDADEIIRRNHEEVHRRQVEEDLAFVRASENPFTGRFMEVPLAGMVDAVNSWAGPTPTEAYYQIMNVPHPSAGGTLTMQGIQQAAQEMAGGADFSRPPRSPQRHQKLTYDVVLGKVKDLDRKLAPYTDRQLNLVHRKLVQRANSRENSIKKLFLSWYTDGSEPVDIAQQITNNY